MRPGRAVIGALLVAIGSTVAAPLHPQQPGRGVGLTLRPQTFVIEAVDPNGLAARAGLRAGDELVTVAGQSVLSDRGAADARIALATTTVPMTVVFVRGEQMHQRIIGPDAEFVARNAEYGAREDAAAERRRAQTTGQRAAAMSAAMSTEAAAPATIAAGLQSEPPAVTAAAEGSCRLGQRVEAKEAGSWYAAVVIGVRPENTEYGRYRCRVHLVGYASTMDSWKILESIRPAGAGAIRPVSSGPNSYDATTDSIRRGGAAAPTAARVAVGHYGCVTFVGGQLVSSGDLTITGAGTYTGGGIAGTYAYDARSGLLRFRGGTWDGQTADYENRGHPVMHVHGRRGDRVMDCEGPTR